MATGRRGKRPAATPPSPDLPRARTRKTPRPPPRTSGPQTRRSSPTADASPSTRSRAGTNRPGRPRTTPASRRKPGRGLFRPRLLNGLFGDPVVYTHLAHQGRAVLCDLGDLGPLWSRALHKLTHVLVSHTHLDHFFDFDRLLRAEMTFLGQRRTPLVLVGPPGLAAQVAARIDSYTWNLLRDPGRPALLVQEIRPRSAPVFRVPFANGQRAQRLRAPSLPGADLFTLETALLDHGGIPSVAFALTARQGYVVNGAALRARGLTAGRWLDDLLERARQGRGGLVAVPTPDGERRQRVATLVRDLLVPRPGQKLGYVADAADTPRNRAALVDLLQDVDWLFIETRYLDEHAALAAETAHLTIGAAADIAAQANARLVTPLHAAGRYLDHGVDFVRALKARFPRLALYTEPVRPRSMG